MQLLPFLKLKSKPATIKPVVLLILDGWGVAPASGGNAITLAKTPNMDYYIKNYLNTTLIASGEAVGLPANEVGNTEVGHLTIGAGRVINQDLKRVNTAIEDKSYFANQAFIQAVNHTKINKSKLHIMGVYGSGKVHASMDHLSALVDFLKLQQVDRAYMHIFTDGRDSPPREAAQLIPELEEKLHQIGNGRIATICGRYWAMDRDGRWERTKKAYEALVLGKGNPAPSAAAALKAAYDNNITDEFIEPTIIFENDKPVATIEDNDAVIFYNYRIDRSRQLTQSFVIPDFGTYKPAEGSKDTTDKLLRPEFQREVILKNLFFVTMTVYHQSLPVNAVAFPTPNVINPLPEVLSNNAKRQLHLAESEKERFVSYYFDGMKEHHYPGEDILIVPSPKVATYDMKPEMSVFDIVRSFKSYLGKDLYHFFVINFANPDMVGHTGNLKKTIEAVEATDRAIGEVVRATQSVGGLTIITADHGNAEELLTLPATSFFFTTDQGSMNTDHSNNPVPIVFVSEEFRFANNAKQFKIDSGYLCDIAPTILAIMKIDIPGQMTGKNIIHE